MTPPSDLMLGFAWTLRAQRALRGWAQTELAARSQLSHPTIKRWERPKHEPSLGNIAAIAEAFGMRPYQLVQLSEDVWERVQAVPKDRRLSVAVDFITSRGPGPASLLVSVDEAARHLGVIPSAVRRWVGLGYLIPAARQPSRFRKETLDAWASLNLHPSGRMRKNW